MSSHPSSSLRSSVRASPSSTDSDSDSESDAGSSSLKDPYDSFDEPTLPAKIGRRKTRPRAMTADSVLVSSTHSSRHSSPSGASRVFRVSGLAPTRAKASPIFGRRSLTYNVFRYPALIFILSAMCLDLVVMFCIRFFVTVYEQLFVWRGKLRKLRNFLGWATDYEDWASAAQILDMHLGNDGWKSEVESDLYDFKLIIKTTNRLRRAREGGDITRLMQLLSNHACKRNFAGCHNESLFSHSYFGSKAEVERFYAEVQRGIEVVRDADIPDSEKRAFLKVVSRNFGRTALCLSGGAAFAYYHMGVLKAFFEQGVLPDVISGSSAGSLMAALVCTRTDAEIVEDGIFTSSVAKYISVMHDGWSVRIKRFWETGAMFDSEDGFRRMEYACKGMTFKESYQISGRILCITVVPDDRGSTSPPKVLNYLTAPDVLISSAIVASSAVPGILVPSRLLCKTLTGEIVPWHGSGRRWRDGSIRTDIPDLSMLNIGCTIVSQVNPHITVFFYEGQGSAGCPTAHRAGLGWRGGFIAASLMSLLDYDLKKWLNLIKDLQLLPPVAATDISSVFLQKFEGTVTVLPANDWRFMDWVQVLADPDEARMDICFRKGATRAYPKVHMIECRMRVEKEIKLLRRECAAGLEDDTESDAGPAARGVRKRKSAPVMPSPPASLS